jgi:hypothetical protein
VVDVPDRADVHVGLVPLELLLAHGSSPTSFVAGGGFEPPTQRL